MLLAAGIFLVAGYLGYTNLVPQHKGAQTVTVETVGPIADHLDKTVTDKFHDPTQVVDFNSPVDLTGLGNNSPFGK
jgi:hypothetical protein